ncbi:MAG: DNA translocase FtsK 4TM domain-containing protein [Paludibacteraceae bacterium]|nr:DNA translocase FtsK 4TM domain-containing protein [Paludibacteraceae bacterium]
MAKKTNNNNILLKIKDFFSNEKVRIIIGIIFIFCAFYLFSSLFSFIFYGDKDYNLLKHSLDEVGKESKVYENWIGYVGARMANTIINQWFGIATLFWPWFLIRTGIQLIHPFGHYNLPKKLIDLFFITIWGSIACAFIVPTLEIVPYIQLGGNHGNEIVKYLSTLIGNVGLGAIIILTLLIYLIDPAIRWTKRISAYVKRKNQQRREMRSEEELGISVQTSGEPSSLELSRVQPEITSVASNEELGDKEDEVEFSVTVAEGEGSELVEQNNDYDPTLDLEYYKYPSYDLLKDFGEIKSVDAAEQQENKERITNTLRNYGITIKKIEATVGPTITLYEIVPDDGIRISKIRNLGDDIALSLAAIGIRIIAPIPGRGTVGIEVPNKNPQIVPMRSLIASEKFQNTNFDLPIAIGKTITNEVFMLDLCKLPHLLVAGATGQGKSVGLNAIITSLLYKKHPSQLKIVLIDPKKTEFTLYSTIEKHFLAKLEDSEDAVISDVTKVTQTLQSVCKEMDTRFDLLKKAHVRNIKEYNEKFISRQLNPENGHRYLPYMVVIIDEFADLIMTAGKEVEMPIARIAQLARAAGIHMIIATQRPSTNIITGSIKANFPGRLAFRVSSMIDSRTILDSPGANQLIGRGDLLFSQGNDLTRVQCAFVDTPEVEAICNFISEQQGYTHAFYLPEVDLGDGGDTNMRGIDMSQRDSMFEDAARLVVLNQSGSTSMIQRKFSIGYNRAGRIMDQLEAAGIVGAPDGSKGRQVLVMDEVQLERILETL